MNKITLNIKQDYSFCTNKLYLKPAFVIYYIRSTHSANIQKCVKIYRKLSCKKYLNGGNSQSIILIESPVIAKSPNVLYLFIDTQLFFFMVSFSYLILYK